MEPTDVAIIAAREAGEILKKYQGTIHNKQVEAKMDFDFVTHVDKESEKKIIEVLTDYFPDYSIMAEESGQTNFGNSRRWIIDPLDGTTNFIHSYPLTSISIALEERNEIISGVIYDPFRDELFRADKRQGAFLNDQPIHVTDEGDLSRCLVATGFPFKDKELLNKYLKAFSLIFHKVSDIRRAGSAALDLAYVASGRLDGYWELILSAWDMAAGVIILKEAGGKITDIAGTANYLTEGNAIATNGRIHDEIFQMISRVFVNDE